MKNFLSTVFGAMAIAIAQPQVILAQAEPSSIQDVSNQVTVYVSPDLYDNGLSGSGVIIAKNGTTYYVLTARHVTEILRGGEENKLITYDGKEQVIDLEAFPAQTIGEDTDLALIQFESEEVYPVATISEYSYSLYERRDDENSTVSDASLDDEVDYVFVAGWPHGRDSWKGCEPKVVERSPACDQRVLNPGFLFDNLGTAISSPDVANPESEGEFGGYELIYTNLTHPGMSGGPVLDTEGRLIGIHGRADGKEIDGEDRVMEKYLDEVGGLATKIKMGLSMGIPIQTFMDWAAEKPISSYLTVEDSAPAKVAPTDIASTLPPLSLSEESNPLYLVERGNQLWRIGKPAEARGSFDNATGLDGNLYLAWFAKGFVLGFDGKYERALEACTRAVELDVTPNNIKYESHRCRAGALQQLNRPEEALSALEEAIAIEQNPEPGSDLQPDKNPADFMLKGELLYALGRHEESLAALQQAITLRVEQKLSDSPLLYNNLALVKFKLGQYKSAKDDTDMAIAIEPNFAPAYRNQGLILETMDRNDESLTAYDKALELDPEDYNTLTNKGFALYKMERVDEAKQAFNRALEINPDYQPAIDNLEAIESAN